MRILSGIQPSGPLHIGNYFGALKQFIDLQHANDAYYFVADYHALTSVRNAAQLQSYTFDVIVTMLSLGLDPEKSTLFVQSDVPETTELAWLLSTVTPMGWLEKCVSYKDKIEQGLPAEHGLFAYPALQAADILLYDADLVPVGQDQKQHLEITRDIAERFNRVYGGGTDVFRLPKPHILESVAVIPGLDGRKMSKSYNNTIDIFDDPAVIRKKVKKFVTDSTPVEAPKNPDTCPLFNLYKLFAPTDELGEVERRYREGGIGYGEVKTRLGEAMVNRFAPARERRAVWLAHPERVAHVRAAGAAKAKTTARVVLDRAPRGVRCGMICTFITIRRSSMSTDISEKSILDALHKVPHERWGHVLELLHQLEPRVSEEPEGRNPNIWTIAELLALPPEKRDAVLETQAALAEHDYRNDPELTAFEAYGPDDLYVDDADAPAR